MLRVAACERQRRGISTTVGEILQTGIVPRLLELFNLIPCEDDFQEESRTDCRQYWDDYETLQEAKEEIASIFINLSFGSKMDYRELR